MGHIFGLQLDFAQHNTAYQRAHNPPQLSTPMRVRYSSTFLLSCLCLCRCILPNLSYFIPFIYSYSHSCIFVAYILFAFMFMLKKVFFSLSSLSLLTPSLSLITLYYCCIQSPPKLLIYYYCPFLICDWAFSIPHFIKTKFVFFLQKNIHTYLFSIQLLFLNYSLFLLLSCHFVLFYLLLFVVPTAFGNGPNKQEFWSHEAAMDVWVYGLGDCERLREC